MGLAGTPCIVSPVYFHSTAPLGSNFLWTFGDGGTSTDSVPDHIYLVSDSFLVTLIINSSQTIKKKIFIASGLDFTYSGYPLVGDTISFTPNLSLSTGCKYLWDFGDGISSRNRVWQAQMIIVFCYVLLFALCYSFGRVLQAGAIKMPIVLGYVCLTVAAVVYALYELVHRHMFIGYRFVFLKLSCMVILSFSFFGLLVVFTQPAETVPLHQVKSYAAFPVQKNPVRQMRWMWLVMKRNNQTRRQWGDRLR